jgi:hypothetical protein
VLLSSGDSFLHLIQKRKSQLGFVTYLLNYPRTVSEPRGSDGIFVRSSNIYICVCVYIDIRFRFVAVWNEAESQDCTNTDELIKCLNPIRVLTDDREFGFSMSREELGRVCP